MGIIVAKRVPGGRPSRPGIAVRRSHGLFAWKSWRWCRIRSLVSHLVTMRVAIITESFPPDVNGVAHCVVRVAELLAARGHQPLVIAPKPPRAKRPPREDPGSFPYPVVRVPAVPLPGYPDRKSV